MSDVYIGRTLNKIISYPVAVVMAIILIGHDCTQHVGEFVGRGGETADTEYDDDGTTAVYCGSLPSDT